MVWIPQLTLWQETTQRLEYSNTFPLDLVFWRCWLSPLPPTPFLVVFAFSTFQFKLWKLNVHTTLHAFDWSKIVMNHAPIQHCIWRKNCRVNSKSPFSVEWEATNADSTPPTQKLLCTPKNHQMNINNVKYWHGNLTLWCHYLWY